jgi:beta-catenin-like protein 1
MNIEGEDAITPEVEDTFYIRRFDGGLFTLQIVDYILAWLMMEDDGVSLGWRHIFQPSFTFYFR